MSEARLKLHIESNKAERGRSGVLPVSVISVSFGRSHGAGGGNGGRGEDVVADDRKKQMFLVNLLLISVWFSSELGG